jgi:glucose/arabinose dehydrogenase
MCVGSPPGSLIYVAVREGLVRVIAPDGLVAAPVLDLRGQISEAGDDGLQSLAFAPDFATSRHMYIYYNLAGTQDAILARYTLSADGLSVVAGSARTIWRYTRPTVGHNGGWLGFASDGKLMLSLGDCGTFMAPDPPNASQNLAGPCGKLMRFDITGDDFPADDNRNFRVPSDNPFINTPGALPMIWAFGLRNPWRCSFDRLTGDLWIADVGHELWEEINVIAPGAGGKNFGWKCREGPICTGFGGCDCSSPTITGPDYAYDHAFGCSILGGALYRGAGIPSFNGRFFFADWCTQHVYSVARGAGVVGDLRDHTSDLFRPGTVAPQGIAAIGQDAAGEMYFSDTVTGVIWKVIPFRCTEADVASLGGALGSDAQLTADDLIAFLSTFFAGDRAVADIATLGGASVPDGQITADDLLLFLNRFFAGCN